MSADYRDWPPSARLLARALDAAIGVVGEADAFADAEAELARLDLAQAGRLLGDVVRDQLEQAFPDGLDTDDAEQVLASCLQRADGLAGDTLVQALTGALGIVAADDLPQPEQRAIVRHGLVIVADLLERTGTSTTAAIETALRELRRAQTVELP